MLVRDNNNNSNNFNYAMPTINYTNHSKSVNGDNINVETKCYTYIYI